MASGQGKKPIREQPRLLELLHRNSFPALQAYARARGEECDTRGTEVFEPSSMRRFTYQVVMGGRLFPAMAARSKKEAREEALQAAVAVLLREEELERRDEPSSSSSISSSSSQTLD